MKGEKLDIVRVWLLDDCNAESYVPLRFPEIPFDCQYSSHTPRQHLIFSFFSHIAD